VLPAHDGAGGGRGALTDEYVSTLWNWTAVEMIQVNFSHEITEKGFTVLQTPNSLLSVIKRGETPLTNNQKLLKTGN
jgi:hypothetical protein